MRGLHRKTQIDTAKLGKATYYIKIFRIFKDLKESSAHRDFDHYQSTRTSQAN